MVGNKPTDFLVDTGAAYSMVNIKLIKESSNIVMVPGVTGQSTKQVLLKLLECQIEDQKIIHSFVYIPDFLVSLLG